MAFHSKYIHDYGIVRSYGEAGFKLVDMTCYRQSGIEEEPKKFTAKGDAGNDGKLDNSLSRTKSRIFELAICNPWEWFATLTLDKTKYDRKDLGKFIKDLSQFIRNYRRKTGHAVKYLLIPEHHQDGAWHLHGFFMGLPVEELRAFQRSDHIPRKLLDRIEKGKSVYTWEAYAKKFGYAVLEPIENHEAVSKYITKYITKEAMNTITELNAHAFYASQGLEQSEIIMQDMLARAIDRPDYKNDYIAVKWFDDLGEALAHFEEVIA